MRRSGPYTCPVCHRRLPGAAVRCFYCENERFYRENERFAAAPAKVVPLRARIAPKPELPDDEPPDGPAAA